LTKTPVQHLPATRSTAPPWQGRGAPQVARHLPPAPATRSETAHGQLPTGGNLTLKLAVLCTRGACHLVHPLAGQHSHRRERRRGAAAENWSRLSTRSRGSRDNARVRQSPASFMSKMSS
jgi:hypothetical protein